MSSLQGTRKHLPVDWRKRLRAVQAAVSSEAKSLPPQLSTDEAVDFFTAQHIRDSLAEDADKGYFGGLKGAAGTWDKVVKAYQKQSKLMANQAPHIQCCLSFCTLSQFGGLLLLLKC